MVSHSFRAGAAAIALCVGLSACSTVAPLRKAPEATVVPSQDTAANHMDPIATAAYWGTRYDRNPGDATVAVAFSSALRTMGNASEALKVMQQTQARAGDQPDVLLELGKAFIANERPHEAVRPIERAIAMGKSDDWSAFSAYGVALDLTGQHRAARTQYDRALALAPEKRQILNNKGLSYALSGAPDRAELTFQEATANNGGTAQIRQNYALILALAGRTTQAERLARSDLPPAMADQNVRYFRELVAQPAHWGDLRQADVELPDFGEDPDTVSMTTRAVPNDPNRLPAYAGALIRGSAAEAADLEGDSERQQTAPDIRVPQRRPVATEAPQKLERAPLPGLIDEEAPRQEETPADDRPVAEASDMGINPPSL